MLTGPIATDQAKAAASAALKETSSSYAAAKSFGVDKNGRRLSQVEATLIRTEAWAVPETDPALLKPMLEALQRLPGVTSSGMFPGALRGGNGRRPYVYVVRDIFEAVRPVPVAVTPGVSGAIALTEKEAAQLMESLDGLEGLAEALSDAEYAIRDLAGHARRQAEEVLEQRGEPHDDDAIDVEAGRMLMTATGREELECVLRQAIEAGERAGNHPFWLWPDTEGAGERLAQARASVSKPPTTTEQIAVTAEEPATVDHSRAHVCAVCGRRFTGVRADARYCSSVCRQRAYRERGGE